MTKFKYLVPLLTLFGMIEMALAAHPEQVIDTIVDQVESGQHGNYGELGRPESIPLGQIQEAWSTAESQAGVYNVNFEPNHIIRLKSRAYATTTIVLPEWEVIEDISIGDNELFLGEKKTKNIASLMPKGEGCDTTLTIIGNLGNVYAFYVRAESVHSKNIPDVVVYVQGSPPKKRVFPVLNEKDPSLGESILRDSSKDYIKQVPFASENITFEFEMSAKDEDSISIAPQKVYSDGIWTWLDYGEAWDKVTLPAVYQIVDSVDTPVNTRVKDSKIIVHGTGPLTLKSGQKIVCITPLKE